MEIRKEKITDRRNDNDSEETPLTTGEEESSTSSESGSDKDLGPSHDSSSDSTKQTFLVVRSC